MSINPDQSTLWMGDLEKWMNEDMIIKIWSDFGFMVEVKMISNSINNQPNTGYCFVKFASPEIANCAITSLNNVKIPFTNISFRLNWVAGFGVDSETDEYKLPEFSIYVGDLDPQITDTMLFSYFKEKYPSVRSVKVVKEDLTFSSKGYGFVRFGDELDQFMSLLEMDGSLLMNRPMVVKEAAPKQKPGIPNYGKIDTTITSIFIGNLSNTVTSDILYNEFIKFGTIKCIKILKDKHCGFIQFEQRASAELAITRMNNKLIGANRVRLSWGKLGNSELSINDK